MYKVCKGCGCLVLYPNTYCDKCKKPTRAETDKAYNKYKRDKQSDTFYRSKEWKALSRYKLTTTPLCEECGKIAEEVHHIKEIRTPEGWADRLKYSGLQSLCVKCHNKKRK